MPRLPRIRVDGAVYLVTSRGSATEPLFTDPQDYEAYRRLIAEYKRRHGVKLFAYCLLPDHVHLCVEVEDQASLSALMHDLTVGYTKAFNKRHGRSGHLFQQRFKAVIAEKASYLLPLTAYLHTHPARSGVTTDAARYPFSSYAAYASPDGSAGGLDMAAEVREALSQLPAGSSPATYEAYVTRFSAAEITQLREALRQRIVGSDEFINRVKAELAHVGEAASSLELTAVQGEPARASRRPLFVGSLAAATLGLLVVFLAHKVDRLEQGIRAFAQGGAAAFRAQLASTMAGGHAVSLEGTVWEIRAIPVNGASSEAVQQDRVLFTQRRMTSDALAEQGFPTSTYRVKRQPNGGLVWETAQSNPRGDVVSWQGEWAGGTTMRGNLTWQAPGKAPERFTFVGVAREPGQTT